MANMAKTFYNHLNEHICEWRKKPPIPNPSDLFVVVIADQRSVLIIVQDRTNRVNNNYFLQSFGATIRHNGVYWPR